MPKETVLVVDDSEEIRHFLRDELLAVLDYEVLTAEDGLTGITIAEQEKPDLILLDINLPKMTGIEVLQALKRKRASIPVIMITSEAEPSLILACFRLGAKDYLQKPFSANEAAASIDKVLSESRWEQERKRMANSLAEVNQELQKRVRAWKVLNQIGQAITATLNEREIQYELMSRLNALMRAESGALFLVDKTTKELVLRLSVYKNMPKQTEIRIESGQGIAGWVFQHGEPLLIPDISKDNRFYSKVDQREDTGSLTRSILAVPLNLKGEVIGVIEVLNPIGKKKQFEQVDVETLSAFASVVAISLENAQLYNQMRSSVTLETLKKTAVTLSHYINNSLTVTIMVTNFLKEKAESFPKKTRPIWISKSADTIKNETNRIAHVIQALNQVTNVKERQYLDKTDMVDIDEELKATIEKMETPFNLSSRK